MFKPATTPKPRTIVLLIVAAVVLAMAILVATHWSDFMRGFEQGYAHASQAAGKK